MKDCIPCTVAFYQEVCRIFFFYKEIQPVHSKGDQSWVFIGRTDVEAVLPSVATELIVHMWGLKATLQRKCPNQAILRSKLGCLPRTESHPELHSWGEVREGIYAVRSHVFRNHHLSPSACWCLRKLYGMNKSLVNRTEKYNEKKSLR